MSARLHLWLYAGKPVEPFEIARLRRLRGPRLEVITFHSGGEFRRTAEEPPCLGGIETGQPGRFKEGGLPVGGFSGLKFRIRDGRAEAGSGSWIGRALGLVSNVSDMPCFLLYVLIKSLFWRCIQSLCRVRPAKSPDSLLPIYLP